MKPTRQEIDIGVLARLLRVWKERKMTHAQQMRMLRLWLGVEFRSLMDKEGRYPEHNFYELSRLLSYRSVQLFLDDIRKSDCFIMLCNSKEGDSFVCSPLWGNYAHFTADLAPNVVQNRNINNIINHPDGTIKYIFKEKEEEKENGNENDNEKRKSRKRNLEEVTDENMETVKEFFHYLNTTPALRHEFFTSFIEEFRREGYTQEWAKKIMVTMMQDTFMPYFARKQEFLNESNDARVTRFRNILITKRTTWVHHAKKAAKEKIQEEINKEKLENNGNEDTGRGKLWR